MRYGISAPNFGNCFHPRVLGRLAFEAEQAGWDGFFIWDHVLLWPTPTVDPWIALATERIMIGSLVTPVLRRRPVKLARETISLDHLSNGRLILGVGIGAGPWEWDYLGEETDLRTRGAMLDEGLDLLTRLWTGEPVLHDGRFYRLRGDLGPGRPEVAPTPMLPLPVQSPRIPIWVAGEWPNKPPFRRAAEWDGVVPMRKGAQFGEYLRPGDVREIVAYVQRHREGGSPFDVVIGGHTSGGDRVADKATMDELAEASATWWIEDLSPWPFGWNWQGDWPFEAMRERVRRGPPSG